ncbi:hypothetical protein [Microbacterium enclense]|uniref:hypothetical protein n=1 Tax=Microbacterium enclense TaxID=993073 RepID=UPI003447FF01
MSTRAVGGAVLSAARVALGILWVNEAVVKLHAGFGAADIALVVDAAAHKSRIPEAFMLFADTVMRPLAPLFGAGVPLWELALGALLIAGVVTLPAAALSSATLLLYWSSDQLTPVYPLMGALGLVVLLWPALARRFGLTKLLCPRMPWAPARRFGAARWS